MLKHTSCAQLVAQRHVLDRDNGCCVLCHSSQDLRFVYYIPLAKGGLPKEKNLFLLCKACWERYKQQEFHAAQRETLRVYLTKWYEDWNIKQLITL